jgi:hypothetical protein
MELLMKNKEISVYEIREYGMIYMSYLERDSSNKLFKTFMENTIIPKLNEYN